MGITFIATVSMIILAVIAVCVIIMATCVLFDSRPMEEHCGLFVLKHISTSRLCTACLVITFVLSIIWALFFPMDCGSPLWNFILRAPAFFLLWLGIVWLFVLTAGVISIFKSLIRKK